MSLSHSKFIDAVNAALQDRFRMENRGEYQPRADGEASWKLGRISVTLLPLEDKVMGDYMAFRVGEPGPLMGHSTTMVPIRADENGVQGVVEMLFSPW